MSNERAVSEHYGQGTLKKRILDGIGVLRESSDRPLVDLLSPVDEFHMGGITATKAITRDLGLKPEHTLLDIGCGLGGAARYFNKVSGCKVHGIDITPEYIEVAELLNQKVGVDNSIDLDIVSATTMPFEPNTFDRASMLHVGMNIPEKAKMFKDVANVMKKDGIFVVYDVMRKREGNLHLPVAWADNSKTSFLETQEHYEENLRASGFEIISTEDHTELALYVFKKSRKRYDEREKPPLGIHLVMGDEIAEKTANMVQALSIKVIAPIQIVARRI